MNHPPRRTSGRQIVARCVLVLFGWGSWGSVPAEAEVDFSRDIRPILSGHCFQCHGPDHQESGLRLDSRDAALRPAESGRPALVPGDPAASELLRRVASTDDDVAMPPRGEGERLTERQLQQLRDWIAAGAEFPAHWAYVRPVKPPVPDVRTATAALHNPIDRFVVAALEQRGLRPSPEASRETLIRRVSLDLIGLPPTLAEVDAFLSDPASDAYERVVDRLLASDRYGEKQARMWLDLARYGDSAGYQHDLEMPLWLYRDWVIEALNADLPFDRFTIEQLAGDLLPDATPAQRIATGFQRCATVTLGADNDPDELRTQLSWDRVNTFGTTWLGSSLECAQCHNHKFDPLSQREYYSLFAYFNHGVRELTFYPGDHYYITGGVLELPIGPEQRAGLEEVRAAILHEFESIEAKAEGTPRENLLPTIRRLLNSPVADRTPERIAYLFTDELGRGQKIAAQYREHVERVQQLAGELDRLRAPRSLVMAEDDAPRSTAVLLRGNYRTPGEEVAPGVPAVLHPLPESELQNRLGLATWVVSPENPLTSRVMVNRWWAEFFGAGIVTTLDDFGMQGEPPSHPELLDWLAVEFMEQGWRMKHIHKLMVMSATYRQSSALADPVSENAAAGRDDLPQGRVSIPDETATDSDPQNRWLSRGPRVRLDAETLRDNALAIAGLLKHELGGRPVRPSANATEQDGHTLYRRSIYLARQRGEPDATLNVFDAPDGFACVARRVRSNTPLQALTLLNEPAFVEAARSLARRALLEVPQGTIDERVTWMFRNCLARRPTVQELTELARLYDQAASEGQSEADAWFLVANVLLNLDETITRE